MTSRSSFTKVLGCALLAAAVGGCTHRDAFPRPKSVQSFCHSGTVNVAALRRVVAGAMDGEHYKSGAVPHYGAPALNRSASPCRTTAIQTTIIVSSIWPYTVIGTASRFGRRKVLAN
jgi:hypothetical protein